MQDFRKLDAWVKAHELVLKIYDVSRALPRDEVFGITMQMRRSALAIPQRIAQACGGEAVNLSSELRKATAMTSDLEYVILVAGDLGFLDAKLRDGLIADVVEVRKMIFGLIRSR